MVEGRVVIIPFLQGKRDFDGSVTEPDIEAILDRWLERHPEFQGPERDYRIIWGRAHLVEEDEESIESARWLLLVPKHRVRRPSDPSSPEQPSGLQRPLPCGSEQHHRAGAAPSLLVRSGLCHRPSERCPEWGQD